MFSPFRILSMRSGVTSEYQDRGVVVRTGCACLPAVCGTSECFKIWYFVSRCLGLDL